MPHAPRHGRHMRWRWETDPRTDTHMQLLFEPCAGSISHIYVRFNIHTRTHTHACANAEQASGHISDGIRTAINSSFARKAFAHTHTLTYVSVRFGTQMATSAGSSENEISTWREQLYAVSLLTLFIAASRMKCTYCFGPYIHFGWMSVYLYG